MMIKKYTLTLLLGFSLLIPGAMGQLTMTVAEETTAASGTVDVDVTVDNFDDITVFEFGLNWDETVLTFNSLPFVVGGITGLDASSFGTPPDLAEGNISCSFFNGTGGQDLDNGTVLFTMRFNVVGAECDSTDIAFNSGSIYSDGSFNTLDMVGVDGKVNIDGTDCGGGMMNGDDFSLIAADVEGCEGGTICVPITVANFSDPNDIGAGEGNIQWDSTILQFTEITNLSLPALFDDNLLNGGDLKWFWFNFNATNPFEGLDDGEVLFEICFDVIGSIGESTDIELVNWDWSDNTDNNAPIEHVVIDGSVTVVAKPVEQFILNVSDETIPMGGRECFDISVGNFDNILALEYRITWDADVLGFGSIEDDIENITLPGLNSGSFSYTAPDNFLTMGWTSANGAGVDQNDGTVIYQVCFDGLGECGETSPVDIVPNGGSTIIVGEEIGSTSQNLPPERIQINNGVGTIQCEKTCDIVNIVGACPGVASGSVTVSVEAGCTCQWTNAGGSVVSNDCNLLGVQAGTYDLMVTATNGQTCSQTGVVVPENDAPTVQGQVTDAGCGGTGAIDVTVSDVSADWMYMWSDPEIGQTLNPTGLDPGNYTITVTDNSTGCTTEVVFVVSDEITPLSVILTPTDIVCFGDLGSITTDIQGGCSPYTLSWSGGLTGENPDVSTPGSYTLTVTDDMGETAMATADVDGPTVALAQNGNAVIGGSVAGAMEGSITLNIIGGTSPYTYDWAPGPLPDTDMLTGLNPGTYSVTVTDDNGCFIELGPFEVVTIVDGEVSITVSGSDYNGVGVSCEGFQDGSINVAFGGGEVPGTLTITGSNVNETRTITMLTSESFDDLGAGDYTIVFTDANGMSDTKEITLSSPLALSIDSDSGCENDNQADGFIDLIVAGGTGMYTYDWGTDPNLVGASVDGLTAGSYTVFVSDMNGCEITEGFIINPCIITNPGCYRFPKIITPNGDGRNELFNASCLTDYPATLTIYDRWGQEIFTQDNYDGTWNGVTQSGVDVIEGGYMWILDISFPEGRRELMKGTVTVLRD